MGRGIFNYSFGLLPHRKPILTVFGEPIPLPKTSSPTKKQLDEYHAIYISALKKLYYDHRLHYDPDNLCELVID